MSRKSQRLKSAVETIRKKLASDDRKRAQLEADVRRLAEQARKIATLTITVDEAPDYLGFCGTRMAVRVDFIPEAFELRFFRLGNPNVRWFCREIGNQLARKVEDALEEFIGKAGRKAR